MKFSTENGRKTKILRMKHPLKIFLQNIASRYRQISAHNVAKIQLLRTKKIVRMKHPSKIFLQNIAL